jgi:hypothetical protein
MLLKIADQLQVACALLPSGFEHAVVFSYRILYHDSSILVGGCTRALHLPLEHTQLLAEESVFEDQFWLGAGHIEGSIEGERMVVRLGPPTASKPVCKPDRAVACSYSADTKKPKSTESRTYKRQPNQLSFHMGVTDIG